MQFTELTVSSEEQIVTLLDGYVADIKFDKIYYRWYYDLYLNNELIYAGISLTPDTSGLLHINTLSLGVVDTGDKRLDYEPCLALGERLALIESRE